MTPAQMDAADASTLAKLTAPDALAKAARWYGTQGIAVFPLKPGTKAPLLPKAHPEDEAAQRECKRACGNDGHGLYDATTDPERIAAWWKANPQANIGLRTGLRFDVIDVDGPPGMRTYIDQIVHGDCPRRPGTDVPGCCDLGHDCHGDGHTLQELTGGVLAVSRTRGENGGLHLFIRPTGDTIGSSIMPGIDYRGDGGYVVAPPSRGRLGIYTWEQPLTAAALTGAA